MLREIVLVLCVIAVWGRCTLAAKPLLGGAFGVCSRSDPQLGQCIVDALNGARDKLAVGIPELNLPPLNPLHANNMLIQEGEEEFNLKLTITNFTWSGIPNFVATKAKIDFAHRYLEVDMIMKQMTLLGPYDFRGKVLTLRIFGDGIGEIKWDGNIKHQFTFEEETRNGEVYWKVKNYKWNQDMTAFHCNFQNLFRGNKRLGLYANEFMNKNWKPAYAIYGRAIEEGLGSVAKRFIIDKFMERVPLNQLFIP